MLRRIALTGLRSRITLALASASIGTALILLLGLLWLVNDLIDQADRRELHGHYAALQSSLAEEAQRAVSMAAVVATMPAVQEAMAKGDRAALLALFESGFASLKSRFGVEQFQFHTAPATAFLRVHMPGKFGDDLSGFRQTVVEANAADKPIYGLEGGVAGLGIRGVMPIDLAGKQRGSVEFGLSFGRKFFDDFKALRHIDVAFHLRDQAGFQTYAGTLDGRSLFAPAQYQAATEGALLNTSASLDARPVTALLGPIRNFSGKPIGAVELVMDNSAYVALVTRAHRLAFAIASLALLIAGVTGWLIARGISRPILGITEAMRLLASGDHQIALPRHRRDDEVGRMAQAVDVFRTNAIERHRLEAENAAAREQAAVDKRAALLGMAETIESETSASMTQIRVRTAAMTATADAMSVSARRTGELAGTAASAAGQALANAETVASAAEQLTASIREIGAQVERSNAVVGRAVTAGSDTRSTIDTLNQQVERIGAVVDMISEIAARTNLLALNATIEAARAGDAGKGFAVVASEVKQLATQTAHSTGEITRHIGEVRAATGASVAAVAQIEQTIGEIHAIAGSIAAAVEQQGAATAEIARNVAETARAANEMTARTAEVSAEAGDTDRHANDVRENAQGLDTAMEALRHGVIRVVRSATPEVDRRSDTRFAVDLPARLTVAGASHAMRVANLSDGGAELHGPSGILAGERGSVTIDAVGTPLPCVVKAAEGDTLHIAFLLDEVAAQRFRGTAARLAQSRAA